MDRRPRTEDEIYRWHRQTLAHIASHGAANRERPPIHESEPHAGWYRRRLVPKGAFVPARIWIEPPETDPETGDQVAPEKMLCEVDGKRVDVFRAWTWLAQHPISEEEYMDMKAGGFRALAPEPEPAPYAGVMIAGEIFSDQGAPEAPPEPAPANGKTCF